MAGFEDTRGGFTSSYQSGFGRDNHAEYTRLTTQIGKNIQQISQNTNKIRRFVSLLGTDQDSEKMRDQLHETQHYTNQIAKDTTGYFKDLSHLPKATSQSEQKQRKMQQERLVEEFTATLNTFQELQRTAASKEKASVRRARAHSGLDSGTSNAFLDDEKGITYHDFDTQSGQTTGQKVLQMESSVDLQLIEEREDAIKKLEKDIMDVNTIFKDLGMLVHEQGEMIDSIEANVESTQIQVESGTEQLAKARDYQSKARRKKCCILIVVLVILAIIGLIIGISVGTKNN